MAAGNLRTGNKDDDKAELENSQKRWRQAEIREEAVWMTAPPENSESKRSCKTESKDNGKQN
jgi:hypothetical protein